MAERILITGGSLAQRIGLRARLAAACHDAQQLPDLAAVTQQARARHPDVVIVIESPDDPGAAGLCAALRQAPATRQAGLVALTGGAGRLAALRAGADDALSQPLDDLLLLARIRRLVAHSHPAIEARGMAEDAPVLAPPARIALIAPDIAMAIGWRHALAPILPASYSAATPAQALQEAAQGSAADLYVIAGDLDQGGDGLRLMSELRARPAGRDAAFVIALDPSRATMAPIALDLGAGDVLPLSLREPAAAQEAALRLGQQLTLRRHAVEQRREDERHRLWAMTDPLTGLSNRRHALPRLDEMLARAQRSGQRLAVMILDLDRFKAVNDRFGHAAGDAVLVQVARCLAEALAPEDLLARIGGEEFLIARLGIDAGGLLDLAEGLRRRIAERPMALPASSGGGSLHITTSIGLALGPADPAGARDPTGEGLMARADHALLAAKAGGRNRVLSAPARAAA